MHGFDQDAVGNRDLIRELLANDRQAFYSNALKILRTRDDSRGVQYLVALLAANDLLLPALCDPALSREQARSLARAAIRVDPAADIELAKWLADYVAEGEPVQFEHASRLLDILGEISDGSRILPSLMRLMRRSNSNLRSKAVLIIGRRCRSAQWAQQRLAEKDPRIRANAVEGLWGVDSEAVRELLQFAARDPNNRVSGNALLGLYYLGDCSVIPEILKMAGHESALFRSTAAWVMGESGDPRFREALAGLLKDPNSAVRKRGFAALGRIKAAAAQTLQAGRWRVAGLFVGNNARQDSRSIQLAVVSEDGREQPRILPTAFILTEDRRQVITYKVVERPTPEAMSVAFILPRRGGPLESPWNPAALACLRWKRTSDLWASVPYSPAGDQGAPSASLDGAPLPFLASSDKVTETFTNVPARTSCMDFWAAIRRSVRTDKGPARGKRHVIVFSHTKESEAAGPELIAATLSSHAFVQVVSSVPNPALEDYCSRTHGNFQTAAADEEITTLIEQAYLNLLARYDITYQPVCPEAATLKIRVHAPSGWGESEIPIPARPSGAD